MLPEIIVKLADFNLFETISYIIILIALIIGSISDIKTREVADWLNYSLIFIGLGIRTIFSIINGDTSFIFEGIIGGILFFVIALIMFYTGQWGGGDSKMIIGLGVLFGMPLSLKGILNSNAAYFLINIIVLGALYGLLWSLFLVIQNRKKFIISVKKIMQDKKVLFSRKIMFVLSLLIICSAFFTKDLLTGFLVAILALIVFLSFYLLIFVKTVEKSCMVKYIPVEKLTEGDWIPKDIIIKGKKIAGPKDLGISKEQIQTLLKFKKQGKIDKVYIKEGIPFVPNFFLAFIATIIVGNIMMIIVNLI